MTRPAVVIVVQARMGSSRLPGKVVAPFGGRPMLAFQLARLEPVGSLLDREGVDLAGTVVATSDRPRDDEVAAVAAAAGVAVHRGPEDDVLERVAAVLDDRPAHHLVRLTADCPWTDPALVSTIVAAHVAGGADYTSNTLQRTWPDGLDVEVVAEPALAAARADASSGPEREHVTPFLQRHPERFSLAQVTQADALGHLRWTVDTEADLRALRGAAEAADAVTASWRALLPVLPGPPPARSGLRLVPVQPGGSTADGTSVATAVPRHPEVDLVVAAAGAPFVRRWEVVDVEASHRDRSAVGHVAVSVGSGGAAEVSGRWPGGRHHAVVDLIEAALAADAQVTSLPAVAAPTDQTGPR